MALIKGEMVKAEDEWTLGEKVLTSCTQIIAL